MKKGFAVLLLLLFLLPVAGMAEEIVVDTVTADVPTEPFTWAQLATIGGAAMATLLIVQLLKLPIDRVWKIPTRIIVFVIAAVILILATYFTQGLTAENAILTLINAVIVALTAMGGYELTFAKTDRKKE